MSRVNFIKITPRRFLEKIQDETGFTLQELADLCKVSKYSFSNWKSQKYLMPLSVFKRLLRISELKSPQVKIFSEYWYTSKGGRKGGKIAYKKYGHVPGWTVEASRKGGLKSIEIHRKRKNKFFIPKPISFPNYSSELAEFFGIVLGDGGISDNQVTVSLGKEKGEKYSLFVKKLAERLFNTKAPIYHYRAPKENDITITISSKNLVNLLVNNGLRRGNKVKNQVKVPGWIKAKPIFIKSCLRGLIDTDGGIYHHKHASHGCKCFNIGLTFTNRSLPVLEFVKNELSLLGFTPKLSFRKYDIYLYRESEVLECEKRVGFSNVYHKGRIKSFFKEKYGRVPELG